ncbi:hypothetical protein [Methylobacterium sp. P5_C11]
MEDGIGFGATIPGSERTSGGAGRADRAAAATAFAASRWPVMAVPPMHEPTAFASPEPAADGVGLRAV